MRPDTARRNNQRMGTVLRYISTRLEESLSLTKLSRLANCAPFHFHRIFRENTGESLHRYIRRLRLDLGAYRLYFTDRPIIQIALDAGYDSHEAFTRAFKQEFGCTPAAFRRRFLDAQPRVAGADRLLDDTLALRAEGARCPEIRIGIRPRRRVAFYRYFGPYAGIRETWGRLADWLRDRGLSPHSTEAFGIVYDDPEFWIGSGVRYDACAAVPPDLVPSGDIGIQVLPEQESMIADHHGPPELAIHTYVRLVSGWILLGPPRRFRRLPYYEVYRSLPLTGNCEEVQTEVHVALEGPLSPEERA